MSSSWLDRYRARTPGSAAVAAEAAKLLAGGVTHPLRELEPYPLAVERSSGARKWDVDGNEYVDYVVGHGALLLGHAHPAIVEAVRAQVAHGTHLGGSHPAEVEWARLVCDLVPCAERVRFTSSGTEAVMLGVRVARAFTGRRTIVKFHGHFHGWSEIGIAAMRGSDGDEAGVEGIVEDAASLDARLARGDVAAVVCEPSGAHFGIAPLDPALLRAMRESASRHGTLLMFDEVVTGFRWAPGGAQERFGVTPDLCSLAKVLGGGLPAGAIAGRADVMDVFSSHDGAPGLFHPGTFNANPLSAAAGIAALREVATREPSPKAEATAKALRDALNAQLERAGVPGLAYGEASEFHILLGEDTSPAGRASMRGPKGAALRAAMLSRGVDLMTAGGMLSCVHGDDEVEATAAAFGEAARELAAAGIVGA